MIPRLGDGNYEDVYPRQYLAPRLENDSPSRGRKLRWATFTAFQMSV